MMNKNRLYCPLGIKRLLCTSIRRVIPNSLDGGRFIKVADVERGRGVPELYRRERIRSLERLLHDPAADQSALKIVPRTFSYCPMQVRAG